MAHRILENRETRSKFFNFQSRGKSYACDACPQRFHLRYDLLCHRNREHEQLKRPISPVHRSRSQSQTRFTVKHTAAPTCSPHQLLAEAALVTAVRERETLLAALQQQAQKLSSTTEVDLQQLSVLVTLLTQLRQATIKFVCAFEKWRQCSSIIDVVPETETETETLDDAVQQPTFQPSHAVAYVPYVWRGQDYIAKSDHDTHQAMSTVASNVLAWLSELVPLRDNPLLLRSGMPQRCAANAGALKTPAEDCSTRLKMKTTVVTMLGRLLTHTNLANNQSSHPLVLTAPLVPSTASVEETAEVTQCVTHTSNAGHPTTDTVPTVPTVPTHIEHVVANWLKRSVLPTTHCHQDDTDIELAYHVLAKERRARWQHSQHTLWQAQQTHIAHLSSIIAASTLSAAVSKRESERLAHQRSQAELQHKSAARIQQQWKVHRSRQHQVRGARSLHALLVSKVYLKLLSKGWLTLLLHCHAERALDQQKRAHLLVKKKRLQQQLEGKAGVALQAWCRGNWGRRRHARIRKYRLHRASATCIQHEWRRNRMAWTTYHRGRVHAAAVIQRNWLGWGSRTAVAGLRQSRLLSLAGASLAFCGFRVRRSQELHRVASVASVASFPGSPLVVGRCSSGGVLAQVGSPIELWKCRRMMALRLQRWARCCGLPGARAWQAYRWGVAAVVVQRMGRRWLAVRRVEVARHRRRLMLLEGIGVDEYVVMRRKLSHVL